MLPTKDPHILCLLIENAFHSFPPSILVTKNPNGECNPQLGENDIPGIILGVGLTLIGVLWTGYSSTAYKSVGDERYEIHMLLHFSIFTFTDSSSVSEVMKRLLKKMHKDKEQVRRMFKEFRLVGTQSRMLMELCKEMIRMLTELCKKMKNHQ